MNKIVFSIAMNRHYILCSELSTHHNTILDRSLVITFLFLYIFRIIQFNLLIKVHYNINGILDTEKKKNTPKHIKKNNLTFGVQCSKRIK